MNKFFDNHDGIIEHALNAFYKTTGLEGSVIQAPSASDKGFDFLVEIITKYGRHLQFAAEVKNIDRFQKLNAFKVQKVSSPYPRLLIAPYISQEMAKRCRDLDLFFLDEAGNAYLEDPSGLLVYVTGIGKPVEKQSSLLFRSLTPAGLRIIFVLLQCPELANSPYREIAKAAKVALGTVGEVLADLESRGYLTGDDVKTRRLLSVDRLQAEWVSHYPIKLRPKLYPMRHAPRYSAIDPLWWKNIDVRDYQGYWGGEVAAAKLTNYLKPATQTIYLQENPTSFILGNRLRPDRDGTIEILEIFWDEDYYPHKKIKNLPLDIAPPLLIYADLMASLDSRNIETANFIHENYL